MHQLRRAFILSTLLAAGAAAAAFAQTTGGIGGRVTDEQEGGLPGVTVEARSPALQGSRTAVSDEIGFYRLTLLPPGDYTVSFTLSGFATETRSGVAVALAKDTTLIVVLRPAAAEEITVTAEVPV
ncbi:MAG TPA: carboxypeptidase-like regulatory domain-containing protein, partial [Thermoanaerobaculia bacterium]